MHLKGSPAYHARSRFVHIAKEIPEWNVEKLDKAISDAIKAEEKASGMKAVTVKEAIKKETKARQTEEATQVPLKDLIYSIGDKLQVMQDKEGSIEKYFAMMQDTLGTTDFKASNATEAQRQQLELLIEGLNNLGY